MDTITHVVNRWTCQRIVSQMSVAMLFELVDRQSPLSVYTWSVCRSAFSQHVDR